MEQNDNLVAKMKVDVEAETPAGAAWVAKSTHPPTTIPSTYKGVPDCSQPNVVRMELKAEVNVPLTYQQQEGSSVANKQLDAILFVSPSGANVGNYVFGRVAGGSWAQLNNVAASASPPVLAQRSDVPNVTRNSGYNFNNWSQDVSSYRTTYKSNTYYLNATNFNNQGIVTTGKFKPKIYTQATAPLSLQRLLEKEGYFDDYVEVTSKKKGGLNSSPVAIYNTQVWALDNPNANATVVNGRTIITDGLPSTSSEIMTSSSKASTRPAVDGAFVVHQPIDPIISWVPNQFKTGSNDIRTMTRSVMLVGQSDNPTIVPLLNYNQSDGSVDGNRAVDTPWNNLDWSYTLFEGLSISNSTTATR